MDLDDLTLDAILDALADKIAERLGDAGTAPAKKKAKKADKPAGSAAAATTPPDVDDGEADDAPVEDEPANKVATDAEAQGEVEVDLVLDEQLDFINANFEKKKADEMRSELSDFYEAYGDAPEEVAKEVAALKGEALTNAYKDYQARLLTYDDSGELDDFLTEWGEPYRAKRLDGGEEVFHWIVDGLTQTDEDAEEKGLGDPTPAAEEEAAAEEEEEPSKKPPKRARKPSGK